VTRRKPTVARRRRCAEGPVGGGRRRLQAHIRRALGRAAAGVLVRHRGGRRAAVAGARWLGLGRSLGTDAASRVRLGVREGERGSCEARGWRVRLGLDGPTGELCVGPLAVACWVERIWHDED
jgi:hypothetical protein